MTGLKKISGDKDTNDDDFIGKEEFWYVVIEKVSLTQLSLFQPLSRPLSFQEEIQLVFLSGWKNC